MKNSYYWLTVGIIIAVAILTVFFFYEIISQEFIQNDDDINLRIVDDIIDESVIVPTNQTKIEITPKIENPYVLSSAQLAKWNTCLEDVNHQVMGIYPDICFTSDGLFARGPLN